MRSSVLRVLGRALSLAGVIGACARGAHAQEEPPATFVPSPATEAANSPLPMRTQLRFKPSYTFPNGTDRYDAVVLVESILPYAGVFVPDLELAGLRSVARLQLRAESLENANGAASGLEDLDFVDLAAYRFGRVDVGVGFGTVFPMATSPPLGQGKWQVGPAVALRVEAAAQLKVAALVQNLYSVAGNSESPRLARVSVQPFVVWHLSRVLFVSSDATMDFYWAGGKTSVPVDLAFGAAFSERFVGSLQGWYTLAGSGQGNIKIVVVLNFVLDSGAVSTLPGR